MAFTLGIDFGTNSVRAVVVDCSNGREISTSVIDYPSGKRGVLLDPRDPNLARQYPGDYFYGLEKSVTGALQAASAVDGFSREKVIGIGVDTTGSSPLPVDQNNTPIGITPKFKDNLSAQCWLWKDHTSYAEAARITQLAAQHRPQFIAKCGNTYSSEWFWSKIWHCLKSAPEVFDAAYSWVELADFIPSILAGVTNPLKVKRGVCPAGHKALYADDWGGLPDKEFLALLDPKLADLRDRLYDQAWDATTAAGNLSAEWAEKLGLPKGIPVAIGEFDVHYGAIAGGVAEGVLVKVIGTSTCDCCVVKLDKRLKDIPGICGIVKGAILPGYYGIEAGQSAVGDIFNWWVEVVCEGDAKLHSKLTDEAAVLRPGQSGLLALDWNNGNRTILVDPRLGGLIIGQTLHTTRAEIYRALIEATAFGARMIIERFREYGVPIEKVVCCGGVAEKNALLMQIYADVTGCTMYVAGSEQTCALGSAISAAVLAGPAKGGYADFSAAQTAMTSLKPIQYEPVPKNQQVYEHLFGLYRQLHDAFSGVNRHADLAGVMKELIRIREEQAGFGVRGAK
jgi:L-ribulokinase